MRVIERRDERKNPVFEVGPNCILFDLPLLRGLVGRDISIINLNDLFVDGRAWPGIGLVGLNFSRIVGREKQNPHIKRKIIRVLAHEVEHVLQPKEGFIDRLAYSLLRLPLLLSLFTLTLLGMASGATLSFWGFAWLSLAFLLLGAVSFLSLMGILLLYYLSPNERDAEAFAEKALKNEEWLKVVKVEDEDTPRAYLLLLGGFLVY